MVCDALDDTIRPCKRQRFEPVDGVVLHTFKGQVLGRKLMEDFIEQIKLILPVVGIRALVPAVSRRRAPLRNMSGRQQYRIKSKGLSATMVELKDGFLVRAGSEASVKVAESLNLSWRNIRTKLLDAHVLKEEGDKLTFAEDAIFASPSAASSVVLGRQSPGPIVWILDDGRTYKEVQAEQTGE
jgi:hypothetical protein